MAVERTIRKYPTIKSLALHLIEINKEFNKLGSKRHRVTSADDGPRVLRLNTQAPELKKPIDSKTVKKLSDTSARLEKLHDQNNALSNMILSLNTNFSADEVNQSVLEALRKNISALQAKIKIALDKVDLEAEERGVELANDKTLRIAKKIKQFLDKRFEAKGEIIHTSGVHEQRLVDPANASKTFKATLPVITIFVRYENIKNARREIEPSIVIAVTEKNGTWYVNPRLIKVLPVGQFEVGFALPDDETQAVATVLKKIQREMEYSSQLSAIAKKAVPFDASKLDLNSTKLTTSFQATPNSIEVTFKPSIKDAKAAEAAAQKCRIEIDKLIKATHPRYKDRVVYEVRKSTKGIWSAVFKFTLGDRYTGRSLTEQENDKLAEVFSEREMKAIRQKLNSLYE